MTKIINPNIKKFIQILGRKKQHLNEIARKMDLNNQIKDRQTKARLHNLLKDKFLINSEPDGRDFLISLTENGRYYLNLFNQLDKK